MTENQQRGVIYGTELKDSNRPRTASAVMKPSAQRSVVDDLMDT